MGTFIESLKNSDRLFWKRRFFGSPCAVHGRAAIFNGCKSLKMKEAENLV